MPKLSFNFSKTKREAIWNIGTISKKSGTAILKCVRMELLNTAVHLSNTI